MYFKIKLLKSYIHAFKNCERLKSVVSNLTKSIGQMKIFTDVKLIVNVIVSLETSQYYNPLENNQYMIVFSKKPRYNV